MSSWRDRKKVTPALIAAAKAAKKSGIGEPREGKLGDLGIKKVDELRGILPPCLKKLFESRDVLRHARGKALLTLTLKASGLDKRRAREIYNEMTSQAGGPRTNIFSSWWKEKFKLPDCVKLQIPGAGYPNLSMGDLKVCRSDKLCGRVSSPYVYMAIMKETITLTGTFGIDVANRAFDLSKFAWNCETKFVTFIKRVTFKGSDNVIEKGATVELPADLAAELEERKLASEKPWMCSKCRAAFVDHPKNGVCPKCNAGNEEGKGPPFFGLRPRSFDKIGDALMSNYRFGTPRESITESNPGLIYVYNSGYYSPVGVKGYIRRKVKQLKPDSKQAEQKNVLDHISVTMALPEAMFGIKGERTVVANGILDLNTGELEPHDPNAHALTHIPIKFNSEAKPPAKFLKRITSDTPTDVFARFVAPGDEQAAPHEHEY